MNLSVALTTFNEEDNISRCLESVQNLADEIVLVDGSSSDKTVEIAKRFKSRVFITNNPTNFHINKQKAIALCKGEWILQLDADEVVPEELKNEIISILDQRPKTKDQQLIHGYWIPRKNYFLRRFLKKGGQYPDYTLRLYKRGKGHLPGRSIHEQAKVEGKTAYLKNPLHHYSYPDFSHYLEHFNLYTSFFANELKENKLNINVSSFLIYFFFKPTYWFIATYIRHKGFQDGFSGFIFSLFSSLRFPVAYIKYWEQNTN